MEVLFSIKLSAKIENLKRLTKPILECAKIQGFDQVRISRIDLALEEAWVNICTYAYPDKLGEIEVNCGLGLHHFIIEIIDAGIPFDMTSLPDPDLTPDISGRTIGGLGIFLIKKMVDEVRYRHENGRNILGLMIKMEKG